MLIDYFFQNFDACGALQFVETAINCEGTLFFTGVGKSGFIANKIAMSMTSVGTKAFFLNPLDALHGDIGMIGSRDVLVVLSKSGSTEELLKLVSATRSRQAKVVGITCKYRSALSDQCDMHIHLPLARELCCFNTAPVTSTILQLIFGDTVTVALMEARGIGEDGYAMNHPAGAIGRKLLMAVADTMRRDLPCVTGDVSLKDTILKMTEGKLGCVFVCGEGNTLIGIFTDKDLRTGLDAFGGDLLNHAISQHMNTRPRKTTASTKLSDVLKTFHDPQTVQCLPVIENEDQECKLIGAITLADVSKVLD